MKPVLSQIATQLSGVATPQRRLEGMERRTLNGAPARPVGARACFGFTLLEMLASVAVLAILMVMLASLFQMAQRGWMTGENRIDTFQQARTIFETIGNDLAQVVSNPNIKFHGTPTALHFVASVSRGPQESADLCEVGYEYVGGTGVWAVVRRFTPPIGGQPAALPLDTYTVATPTVNVGNFTGSEKLGFRFDVVDAPIEITHWGIFDHNADGLTQGGVRWSIHDTVTNWYGWDLVFITAPNQGFKSDGFVWMPLATPYTLPKGKYRVCGWYWNSNDRGVTTAGPVFNSGNGLLANFSPRVEDNVCATCTGASFKFRPAVSASVPPTMTIPTKWNVYDSSWWNTFDSQTAVASNSVMALNFGYMNQNGSIGTDWNDSTLPKAVQVTVTMLDMRGARQIVAGGSLTEITNKWGRTFSTLINLTSSNP